MDSRRGIRQKDPLSPLVFVIIVEYLNMSFHKMRKNLNFYDHAKCVSHKITNLAFADDVLLFAMGDHISIEMMLNTLNKLFDSTNLKVNPTNLLWRCDWQY